MADALWMTTGAQSTPAGTATVTAAGDTLTIASHTLVDGQQVRTSNPTGGALGELVPGAPYYVRNVNLDDFQLSPSPGAPVMTFELDGTVDVAAVDAEYEAAEMRRLQTALMWPGASGVQTVSGIKPGNAIASLAGFTLTVNACTGVANPGGSPWATTDGAYSWALVGEGLTVTSADGTQDRIDRVVARIQDTAIDGSNERQAVPVIKDGVPAGTPLAPTVDAGEVDMGTIYVYSTAVGDPPEYTPPLSDLTAVGGTKPVADDSSRPTVGLSDGMRLYRADIGVEEALHDGSWQRMAAAGGKQLLDVLTVTTTTAYDLDTLYPNYSHVFAEICAPGGGSGGCSATAAGEASCGSGGGGGQVREAWIARALITSPITVTIGPPGVGGADGATEPTAGANASFGSLLIAQGGERGESDSTAGTGRAVRDGGSASTGGSTTVGGLDFPGGAGRNAVHDLGAVIEFGNGGSSRWCGAGRVGGSNTGNNGIDGPGFGAGASGAHNTGVNAARPGGDGGPGGARIWVYA